MTPQEAKEILLEWANAQVNDPFADLILIAFEDEPEKQDDTRPENN